MADWHSRLAGCTGALALAIESRKISRSELELMSSRISNVALEMRRVAEVAK